MNQRQARKHLSLWFAGATLLGLGYGLAHVRADGAPKTQPLWYAGTVADPSGAPLEGNHAVSVRLFDSANAAFPCPASPASTAFVKGRFRLDVSACLEAVRSNADLSAELTVDSQVFPRSKIGAVPYAIEAGRALSASTASGALKQTLDQLPKITEWKSFVPDIFAGTAQVRADGTKMAGRFRRVGDTAEVQVDVFDTSALAGLAAAAPLTFALPSGLSPDMTKTRVYSKLGVGNVFAGAGNWIVAVQVEPSGRLALSFSALSPASAGVSTTVPADLRGAGSAIQFSYDVPVTGWTLSTP